MSIIVRSAANEDSDAIAVVAADALAFHNAARPDLFLRPDVDDLERYICQQLEALETKVLVAELEPAAIVGYAFVKVTRSPANPFRAANLKVELDQIGVVSSHRGQGVGTVLVAEVVRVARAEGAGAVDLTVWSFNDGAVRLYERAGFATVRHHMRLELGA